LSALEQNAGNEPRQLRAFVEFSVRLFAAGADIIRIAQLAGRADPDIAALWDTGNARRLATVSKVLADWEQRGALRDGLSTSRAADILWSFTSAELYSLLVHERGWSRQDFEEWMYELAAEQLLRCRSQDVKASR
jgi:hypothetical protein